MLNVILIFMTKWEKLSEYAIREDNYLKRVLSPITEYVLGNYHMKKTRWPIIFQSSYLLLNDREVDKLNSHVDTEEKIDNEYSSFESNLRFTADKKRKMPLRDVINEKNIDAKINIHKNNKSRRILDSDEKYIDDEINDIYSYLEDAKEDIETTGKNSDLFTELILKAKPKKYEDFEKIKVAYKEIKFDDEAIFK